MRIFIDCTHTAKHKYKNTGIHRVVRELTSELSKITLDKPNIEIVPVMFDNHFMRRVVNLNSQEYNYFTKNNFYANAIIKIFRKLQIVFYRVKNRFLTLLIPIFDGLTLNVNKKNVVLEFENSPIQPEDIYIIADANWDLPKTYYRFLQNLRKNKVIIVLISYDLIPIKFPEFSSKNFTQAFTLFYQEYSSLCDKVLCISKNSAEDYKTAIKDGILANSNPDLIVKSFRLGCNYSFHNVSQDRNVEDNDFKPEFREIPNKQYILVVGSLVPHKNIKTIISAFDLLLSCNYQNINLVFAGNKGWHSETDSLIESHEMCGKFIHILGSVTDVQLRVLYENCYCLVQASFYEGFGLPVVEALQNRKPVVASNGGSLPEVGGDFCIYFDPTQPIELYQALQKLLDSETYYNHLVDRITNEYKPFLWRESAEEFLDHLCN